MSFIIDPYRFVAAAATTIDLNQTDTAATCSIPGSGNVWCAGVTAGGDVNRTFDMRDGGTLGGTALHCTVVPGTILQVNMAFVSNAIGETTWDSGDYITRANLTTGVGNTSLEEIHVCRINTSCTNEESLGSIGDYGGAGGLGISVNSTGVIERTISCVAGGTGGASVATTDKIAIVYVFINTHAHASRTPYFTPDQIVETPIIKT